MAVKTYVLNTANTQLMADATITALQPLVTSGLFDSIAYAVIEYPSGIGNHGIAFRKGGVDIIRIAFYGTPQALVILFRTSNGTYQEAIVGNPNDVNSCNAPIEYVYTCSGGVYLATTDASSRSNTGKYAGVYITKTNNDKIGVFVVGATTNSGVTIRTNYTRVFVQDAAPESMSENVVFQTPQARNQTTMFAIPTACEGGVTSRFPDLLYTFTSQDAYTDNTATPPFNFTQNGKRYLWTGCYALRDEEVA